MISPNLINMPVHFVALIWTTLNFKKKRENKWKGEWEIIKIISN